MTPLAAFCCCLPPSVRPPNRPWQGQVALLLACLAAAVLAAAVPAAAQQPDDAIRFERDKLTIDSVTGRHRFDVELAITPEQRGRGLMFRLKMAPDAGMLFVYARRQPIAMWMKNTFLPLDMLFIDKDGTIVRIVEWTEPQSLATIESGGRVLGVLELNAGSAARLGVVVGDRVIHSVFD